MNSKKVLALMMGAIVASSVTSQTAVQVYAHDEESSSSSYSYDDSIDIGVLDEEESSSSSEPMEDGLSDRELTRLENFTSRRANELLNGKSLQIYDLDILYVSESNLVFEPITNTEARLVCLDEEREFDGNIVVPEKVSINGELYSVTSIGNRAFYECGNLENVTLPASITRIGIRAFSRCDNLQLEVLPEDLEIIGEGAFLFCDRLNLRALPNHLHEIGNRAFSYCINLRLEGLPEGLKVIGERAFNYCEDLQLASLPEGLEIIGKSAFANTDIRTITIPASVIELGDSAFNTDSIEEINLAQGSRLNDGDIRRAYGRQLGRVLGFEVSQERLHIVRQEIIMPVELNAEDPEDICSVCEEKFNEENGGFGRLRCGHYMHLDCFEILLRNSFEQYVPFKCPICRREYNIF